jgi:hypothetical protein
VDVSASHKSISINKKLAERVGFEPTLPFRVNTLSKRAPSATRPSLRRKHGKHDCFPEGYPIVLSRLEFIPTWLHFILWWWAYERKSSEETLLKSSNGN